MDIHKPKPWHSVREFLKEYLIIVVGVLTALAAEQAVQNLHWQKKLAETRVQIRAEMSDNVMNDYMWLVAAPCLDQELDSLTDRVWAARRTGTFEPLPAPYAPPLRMFRSDAWLNARSLQVSDHLSPEETRLYSTAYFMPSEMKETVIQLHLAAAALEPLRRRLDRVTPAEADQLLAQIGRARELQARMHLAAVLTVVVSGGLKVSAPQKQMAVTAALERQVRGACALDPVYIEKVLHAGPMAGMTDLPSVYRQLNLAPPPRD
jgi:hypothetical protein